MLVIGFANEFYTLWDVSKQDIYSSVETASGTMSYKSGEKIYYWYQKNISKDLDKVKALYPDLKIDENLKGISRSWSTSKDVDETPHILKFGKYAGQTVTEVAELDWKYFLWLIDNCYKAATKEECYKVQKYIDFITEQERTEKERLAAINTISEGINEIELTFNTNPNHEALYNLGCYAGINDLREILKDACVVAWGTYGNNTRIAVVFSKEQVKYVDGIYPYHMGIFNGKAKRLKNKSFKFTAELLATDKGRYEITQVIRIK